MTIKRINLQPKDSGLKFTTNWVGRHIPTWRKYLKPLYGKKNLQFLEIGSWEGRSACWFLQNILTHPTSSITCIDTFSGSLDELRAHQHLRKAIPTVEQHFDHNIRFLGASKRVRKIKADSQRALRSLPINSFDCMYIDGSHLAADVLTDAVLSWALLKTKGIMIFDDYRWKSVLAPRDPFMSPKLGIDTFRKIYCRQMKVLSIGTQLIVQKLV